MYSHGPQANLTSGRPNQPFRAMAYSNWPEPRPGQDRKQIGCMKLWTLSQYSSARTEAKTYCPYYSGPGSVPILVLVPLSENTP